MLNKNLNNLLQIIISANFVIFIAFLEAEAILNLGNTRVCILGYPHLIDWY
jgi:hypothetical protein